MALSDCPKCWNTPCDCGYDYKDWSIESLEKMADIFNGLISEKQNQMKTLPKKIIRLDDGGEFLLNEATQTYELWMPGMKGHLHNQYTYERLMEDPRSKGAFKVADGTEDIRAMRQDWLRRMNENRNDGHGNEE